MPPRRSRKPRTSDRRVQDLGEFELIERIGRVVGGLGGPAPRAGSNGAVVLGMGDDAALVRARAGEEVAVSTDAAVENVHFDWGVDDAACVGRRALAAALSDLAAMGARPLATTLALAIEPRLPLRRLDAALRGFVSEAAKRGAPLVGGNLARAGETSFSVTVLGACARGRALRRDRARAGDALFVTGVLGASVLARARARENRRPNRFVPPCRLAAGRALARLAARGRTRVACIDLSDGLAADLPHLLERPASRKPLGAEIDASALPRARGFERRALEVGLDPLAVLVAGGEDYELLFALSGRWSEVGREEARARELSRRLAAPVSWVGRVTAGPGITGLPLAEGYRHF